MTDQGDINNEVDKKRVFCFGVCCEYLEQGEDDNDSYVTCRAKRCPYSKKDVERWYKDNDRRRNRKAKTEEETG